MASPIINRTIRWAAGLSKVERYLPAIIGNNSTGGVVADDRREVPFDLRQSRRPTDGAVDDGRGHEAARDRGDIRQRGDKEGPGVPQELHGAPDRAGQTPPARCPV